MVPNSSPTTPIRPPDPNRVEIEVGFAESWGPSTATTFVYGYYGDSDNTYGYPRLNIKTQNAAERQFEKGKFFKFESSREFRQWFGGPKTPVKLFRARHGFQQMARIPCYRGVRTR